MPKITNYKDFENYWNKFLNLCDIKIYTQNSIIEISEKEKSGKGEIYLEFSNLDDKKFVVEILTSPKNNSCCIKRPKNCDGILMYIDLINEKVKIYLIELKTTLTNKIEEANEQIRNAYWFISSLNLFQCFKLTFEVILAYKNFNKTNLLTMTKDVLKNEFKYKLYSYVLNDTYKFPIMLPFCKYIELKLELMKFSEKKII